MIDTSVIGNVGMDAEVRDVNGRKVINWSVAHDESYTDRQGVKHDKVLWINCAKWLNDGQSAEVAKYLIKGTKVYVSGKPDVRMFQRADGSWGCSFELKVRKIELLGSHRDRMIAKSYDSLDEKQKQQFKSWTKAARDQQPAAPAAPPAGGGDDQNDDDLPF